jgi:hypothetical protein
MQGRNSRILLECASPSVNKCYMLSDIAVSISSKYFTPGISTVKFIVHEYTFSVTSLITGKTHPEYLRFSLQ